MSDSETITLDFIFVPEGEAPPIAWLQAHPDHVRLPAILVEGVMAPRGIEPPH